MDTDIDTEIEIQTQIQIQGRQNHQDQIMTAHTVREESGIILGLLTPISLTFKVLYFPRFFIII